MRDTIFGNLIQGDIYFLPTVFCMANHEGDQRVDHQVFPQTIADRPLIFSKGICVQVMQGDNPVGMEAKNGIILNIVIMD
ncbi:MAG: hypothetical protein ACJAVR_004135 [Paracoccaceae bacterium]|jgi:hypothetical protein